MLLSLNSGLLLSLAVLATPHDDDAGTGDSKQNRSADSDGFGAKLSERFVDPSDGNFDVSAHLLTHRGVLPVPILITEPALGYGGGVALTYFHSPLGKTGEDPWTVEQTDEPAKPPSISTVFGGLTDDGNRFYGGAHFGSWLDDRVRYLGLLARGDLELDFYFGNNAYRFELEAPFLHQRLMFRLNDTDFFLGTSYTFASTDAKFKLNQPVPGTDPRTFNDNNAGLALRAQHDNRDNIFTPNSGHAIEAVVQYNGGFTGGDYRYWEYHLNWRQWFPVHEDWVLGLRADGAYTDGDEAFYARPFIKLRGIPAMRYQGEFVTTFESEVRYDFTRRWSALVFGGAGYAENNEARIPDPEWEWGAGFGFRYLLARALGARAGLDFAFSNQDEAIYIQFGHAW